ncbi:hypothetical protein ABFS82_13G028200 [Erythranthe guttata]|uniref:BHLH domain-containing protein n=1 Tax=Erythranthe guttata TaxID=4155 RepID=A0A022QBC1_ERYGU|nr:hypothetical protein MIMGU_mgv1a025903mg [Erythranthe guttata]
MEKQARYCSPNSSSSAPRIERKITEKNRRNQMKLLFSNLTSLLPHHTSKVEGLPVPDQIDEAVEYIKSMKTKLEEMSRKDSLKLPRKEYCDQDQTTTSIEKTPLVEVHNMGPNIDVVLAKGLKDFSTFHDIIRMLHRHEVEVASATFARCGNSTIQILQDNNNNNKDGQCRLDFGGEEILRKVEELVCGANSSTEIHSQSNLWDYEIESNIYLRIN